MHPSNVDRPANVFLHFFAQLFPSFTPDEKAKAKNRKMLGYYLPPHECLRFINNKRKLFLVLALFSDEAWNEKQIFVNTFVGRQEPSSAGFWAAKQHFIFIVPTPVARDAHTCRCTYSKLIYIWPQCHVYLYSFVKFARMRKESGSVYRPNGETFIELVSTSVEWIKKRFFVVVVSSRLFVMSKQIAS